MKKMKKMKNLEGSETQIPTVTLLLKKLPRTIILSQLQSHLATLGINHSGVRLLQGKRMRGWAFVDFKTIELAINAKQVLEEYEGFTEKIQIKFGHNDFIKTLDSEDKLIPQLQKDFTQGANSHKPNLTPLKPEPIAPNLGINYPFPPDLKYKYPNPTPAIVTNIAHALLHHPRFYEQVLHLMNKMNLPPPFQPEPKLEKLIKDQTELSLIKSEIEGSNNRNELLATDESELESSSEEESHMASNKRKRI